MLGMHRVSYTGANEMKSDGFSIRGAEGASKGIHLDTGFPTFTHPNIVNIFLIYGWAVPGQWQAGRKNYSISCLSAWQS